MEIKSLLTKYLKPILIVLAAIILFTVFTTQNDIHSDEDSSTEILDFTESLSSELQITEQTDSNGDLPELYIIVDVKGAVLQPNVYELLEGSRVLDAINMAGGFAADADQTKINLAARLQDEMVIYVPKIGENIDVKVNLNGQNDHNKININTATVEELQRLQGIGPSKAESIITYREEHGRFQTINDLLNVSGIGEKSLEKIVDEITVR
ncbi:helix-hairpin-helix domain-containing protein [Calidifontibacillus oryziterrae]|uniref:helix-hairpin-helix domain-containing protein n=1 Tax=Calidifontibacillus oryziterrae TaxID=1191699 RepID=UPI00031441D0|nr:helix-hairpin-helix domain-containing protein [Calidifontibacillus oryziterrae]